jgi:hypothetical protein
MSEALIASLNQRINELTGQNSNLKAALKEERSARKSAAEKLAEAEKAVGTLTTERDTALSAAKAAPDDLRKQITDLQGQLAQRDHRDAFRAAARDAGVSGKAIDDLYSLSGLKPGETPADPAGFAEFLAAQKEVRPWAFDGESPSPQGNGATTGQPAGGSQGIKLAPAPAPAGAGRGVPDHSSSKFRVTRDQLADGLWMQANQDAMDKAAVEGRLEIV